MFKTSIYSDASTCSHSLSNSSILLSRPKTLVENGCTDRGHLVPTTSKLLRCQGRNIRVRYMMISGPMILKLKGFLLLKQYLQFAITSACSAGQY